MSRFYPVYLRDLIAASVARSSAVLQFLLLLFTVILFSLPALADKPDGKVKPKGAKSKSAEQSSDRSDEVEAPRALMAELSPEQRDQLADLVLEREYGFSKNSTPPGQGKALPPGLQKKLERGGSLPPGWQKRLSRGEQLDAQAYEQSKKLPDELLRRITGRDDAVELLQVGDRILRVMEGRGTILDVIDLSDRAVRMLE